MVVVAIAARYKGYRIRSRSSGTRCGCITVCAEPSDVEELMLARGVVVTHETIRSWCAKLGPDYAAQ